MVTYKAIKKIGEKLRESGKEEISVSKFFQFLREETGSIQPKTLRRYAELLRVDGFITWESWETLAWEIGVLKIIRNGDKDEK